MRRYLATFFPQAWANDDALDVDPEGPSQWDCTAAFRALPKATRRRVLTRMASGHRDGDVDVIQHDPRAPGWVRAWRGPFAVAVEIINEPRQLARIPLAA